MGARQAVLSFHQRRSRLRSAGSGDGNGGPAACWSDPRSPYGVTTTCATIEGWIEQWYAYVPAFLKVIENVPQLEIWPLSKLPASAVTVCVRPWFVQVTVVPALTVTASGLNAKSTIDTMLVAAGVAAAAGVADAATGDELATGDGLASSDAGALVAGDRVDELTDCAALGAVLAHPTRTRAVASPRATSQCLWIFVTTGTSALGSAPVRQPSCHGRLRDLCRCR